MLNDAYKQLSSPVSKETIDCAFCNNMIRRGICRLNSDQNCNRCLPILQEVITTAAQKGENVPALTIWLFEKVGTGEAGVWTHAPKAPIKTDIFYTPRNPFEKLMEEL